MHLLGEHLCAGPVEGALSNCNGSPYLEDEVEVHLVRW